MTSYRASILLIGLMIFTGVAFGHKGVKGTFYFVQNAAWHPVHQLTQQAFLEGCKDVGIVCKLATTDETSLDALVALAEQTVARSDAAGVSMWAGWLKGWMEGNAPDASGKFKVATLPTEFAANWGGSYIAIPSETENAQAAYDFVEWLVSPENQLKSFQSNGLFPSAPSVYEMEEFTSNQDEFFGGQVTSEVFAQAAQDIEGAVYKGEKYFPVHQEVLNALKNVQDGADPEKEWKAAVKRAQDLVSR